VQNVKKYISIIIIFLFFKQILFVYGHITWSGFIKKRNYLASVL
jgi:hypothetical protein